MKITISAMAAIIFISIAGCIGTTMTGYEFETKAVYKAIHSKLLVTVSAKGKVKPGEDTGTGIVDGCVFSFASHDSINFIIEADTLRSVSKNSQKKILAGAVGIIHPIMLALDSMYLMKSDSAEIAEIEKILLAIGHGPKATFMKGQTKAVNVEYVNFTRK